MASPATPEVFTDITVDPFVRGWLHRPATANGDAIVLTHGAGGNCNAPLLVALGEIFSAAGYFVLRVDLPYRQRRPYGPPGPGDAKRDRAGLNNALTALGKMFSNSRRLFLGGQSYGGRQCSMLCSGQEEKPAEPISGLLLMSYPLHPPGKPEQLRTGHFSSLQVPTLFIEGTHDPFGSIAEIERSMKQIPGRIRLVAVEGVGHDLGFKGKAKCGELPANVLAEFQSFFAG
jgi:uncharacterized protein